MEYQIKIDTLLNIKKNKHITSITENFAITIANTNKIQKFDLANNTILHAIFSKIDKNIIITQDKIIKKYNQKISIIIIFQINNIIIIFYKELKSLIEEIIKALKA